MHYLCMNRLRMALVLGLVILTTGCNQGPAEPPAMPPPAVTVSPPQEKSVTDYADFTGRLVAVESVQVRARAWGHLQKINFKEGSEVKKDDLLFLIDPRPYQAALDRAEADISQAEARTKRLEFDFARARKLAQTAAMGREEFDKVSGDLSEAKAAVQSANAARDAAKLNLEYTEVKAPISGRIGRALVTVGNLVQSGEMGGTVLTTIVSIDPTYVHFDVDDLTFMKVRQLIRRSGNSPGSQPSLLMALAHEKDYPHHGTINFVDNQVEPGTGTMKIRGLFQNKDRILTPGLFVRVRVPLGESHKAILIADRAIDTDQGQKIVYVVNKQKVVERRPVQLGGLFNGLREILSGLRDGETVVIDGLQRVRDGVTVDPHEPAPAKDKAGETAGQSKAKLETASKN
ncbi:efflux RND transporter periplasmic adaptor subunit [soil metagenome]